jgi:hypothetical protein
MIQMHVRGSSLALAAAIAGTLVLTGARALSTPSPPPPRPVLRTQAPAPAPSPAATPLHRARRARAGARAPRPVRLQIPAIGVDAPLVPLGLDASGALRPPAGFSEAGWWSGGTRPGERGPAVIVGHVDNKTGPAIFFRVPQLRRGDAVVVTRRDGTRVRFTVQRSGRYAKTGFPTRAVYGPTARPALRLITCSGTFDRSTGHYLDNTVVFAGAA